MAPEYEHHTLVTLEYFADKSIAVQYVTSRCRSVVDACLAWRLVIFGTIDCTILWPCCITNKNKNSSGDEIANVNFLTTKSHTRRPTSKYRKRDKPTSFNKLDDRLASTAHEVLNFSICYLSSLTAEYSC